MIPTRTDLLDAYEQLQFHSTKIDEQELLDYAQLSRFDPRLAELVVKYLQQNFKNLNPLLLWQLNKSAWSPQALFALADIVDIQNKFEKVKNHDWKIWKSCIQAGGTIAPLQSYYIGLTAINPERQLKQLDKNLKCFSRWGFYCDELPISEKNRQIKSTLMPKAQRLSLLRSLLKVEGQITVNDYLRALNYKAHRRQAERDIAGIKGLRRKGKTKGRVYILTDKSKQKMGRK